VTADSDLSAVETVAIFVSELLATWVIAALPPLSFWSQALRDARLLSMAVFPLDLSLPDSQGLATFRALRQAAPEMPVIVLTGTDDDEQAMAAVREGAQDYLIKGQITAPLVWRAIRYAVERQKLTGDLRTARATAETALAQVKSLGGLLPICAGCKKIRDSQDYWHQVESYIAKHTDATFTHGYCPDCIKKYFPELEQA
jgi:CheY-like chemotaxis protein